MAYSSGATGKAETFTNWKTWEGKNRKKNTIVQLT